ncbi:MAG: hypothetical protein EPO36_00815 [Chloroflexota bacterium]|nr:MAG: hypothetical protein EPO36_00815 [Chloroflexota bacterium]
MTETFAERISAIKAAQAYVAETVPRTKAWRDAQRAAIGARADYWTARISSQHSMRRTSEG